MLIGSNVLYFTQMIVGLIGMPRRYADYPPIPEWVTLNGIQTWGAFILAAGILVTFIAWFRGLKGARRPSAIRGARRRWSGPPPRRRRRRTSTSSRCRVPAGWSPYRYDAK